MLKTERFRLEMLVRNRILKTKPFRLKTFVKKRMLKTKRFRMAEEVCEKSDAGKKSAEKVCEIEVSASKWIHWQHNRATIDSTGLMLQNV